MACSLLGNTLIYNSRNCYGLIANAMKIEETCTSTIVEIVMAL